MKIMTFLARKIRPIRPYFDRSYRKKGLGINKTRNKTERGLIFFLAKKCQFFAKLWCELRFIYKYIGVVEYEQ